MSNPKFLIYHVKFNLSVYVPFQSVRNPPPLPHGGPIYPSSILTPFLCFHHLVKKALSVLSIVYIVFINNKYTRTSIQARAGYYGGGGWGSSPPQREKRIKDLNYFIVLFLQQIACFQSRLKSTLPSLCKNLCTLHRRSNLLCTI